MEDTTLLVCCHCIFTAVFFLAMFVPRESRVHTRVPALAMYWCCADGFWKQGRKRKAVLPKVTAVQKYIFGSYTIGHGSH